MCVESVVCNRRIEGQPLPDWHPLWTGDADSVHRAGMFMRGRVTSEDAIDLDQIEDYAFDE